MNNTTRYVCPRCGHALRFWNSMQDVDTPCRCDCPKCLKEEPDMWQMVEKIGVGKNATEAFEDWQNKNPEAAKSPAALCVALFLFLAFSYGLIFWAMRGVGVE